MFYFRQRNFLKVVMNFDFIQTISCTFNCHIRDLFNWAWSCHGHGLDPQRLALNFLATFSTNQKPIVPGTSAGPCLIQWFYCEATNVSPRHAVENHSDIITFLLTIINVYICIKIFNCIKIVNFYQTLFAVVHRALQAYHHHPLWLELFYRRSCGHLAAKRILTTRRCHQTNTQTHTNPRENYFRLVLSTSKADFQVLHSRELGREQTFFSSYSGLALVPAHPMIENWLSSTEKSLEIPATQVL